MCLKNSPKATKAFREKHRNHNGKMITVYKEFSYWSYSKPYFICGPFYSLTKYQAGENVSNRKCKWFDSKNEDFVSNRRRNYCRGIHVYLTKHHYALFPVQVRYEDLVACGTDGDAIFMKITISKQTMNRIKKRFGVKD